MPRGNLSKLRRQERRQELQWPCSLQVKAEQPIEASKRPRTSDPTEKKDEEEPPIKVETASSSKSPRTSDPTEKKDERRPMTDAAKPDLAQAAVRVMVKKEEKDLLAKMAGVRAIVAANVTNMFETNRWSLSDLSDYSRLKKMTGGRQFQEHIQKIAKGFQKEYGEATKWKEELSKHSEISAEVSIQHLALKDFLDAVEAANLHMREL